MVCHAAVLVALKNNEVRVYKDKYLVNTLQMDVSCLGRAGQGDGRQVVGGAVQVTGGCWVGGASGRWVLGGWGKWQVGVGWVGQVAGRGWVGGASGR